MASSQTRLSLIQDLGCIPPGVAERPPRRRSASESGARSHLCASCGVGLLVPWCRRWRPEGPPESSPGLRPSGRCPGFAPEHPPGLKGRQRSGDGRNGGRIRGCAASSGDPSGRGFEGTWGDPGQCASRTRRAGLGWVRAARWAAWPPEMANLQTVGYRLASWRMPQATEACPSRRQLV